VYVFVIVRVVVGLLWYETLVLGVCHNAKQKCAADAAHTGVPATVTYGAHVGTCA
jgi:hypothetical protein